MTSAKSPKAEHPKTWTTARDAQLRQLWPDPSHSARTIAEALGLNRNQVIGRAHRLILAGSGKGRPKPAVRPSSLAAIVEAAPPPSPRPHALALTLPGPVPSMFADDPVAAAIHGLRSGVCRYPIGDPVLSAPDAPFRFCCAPVARPKRPYCAEHDARCVTDRVPRMVPVAGPSTRAA